MEEKEIKRAQMELSFSKLWQALWADRRMMIIYCGTAALIGIVVAFSIPKRYRTQVILAPESSSTGLSSSLTSIASMVGMNMKNGATEDALSPELYPDLMKSMDFVTSLFDVKVNSLDGRIHTTYSDYIQHYQKSPWWGYPSKMLGELVGKLMKKSDVKKTSNKVSPFELTKEQYGVAMAIAGSIKCSVDKTTSIISLSVTAQDPLISATMADSVMTRLQTFITNYRTNKARHDLAYMQRLFREAKNQYTAARQAFSSYSDTHQELALESYKSAQDELENEMQLKYNIYTQVAQQLQMAMAKVQERTPVFTVVQSASVPLKHCNTPKVAILFVFVVIGFALRLFVLFIRKRPTIAPEELPAEGEA